MAYEWDDSDKWGKPFSTAKKRFIENECLMEFEPHSPGFIEDLKPEIAIPCLDGSYRVLMPSEPTDALDGIDRLRRYGWRFDVIDIDSFGSSLSLFEKALDVVQDGALVFLTVGDMYQGGKPTGYKQAFAQLGCDFASVSTSTERFFWRSNLWRAMGARFVLLAREKGFCLAPFGAYVAAQPTKHIEFEGQKKVCGIDRLFFLARKLDSSSDILLTPEQVVMQDSLMGCKVLNPQLENSNGQTRPLPFFRFTDIWDARGHRLMADTSLPESITTKLSEAFKWSASILAV